MYIFICFFFVLFLYFLLCSWLNLHANCSKKFLIRCLDDFTLYKKVKIPKKMADSTAFTCQTCGNVGMVDGADGFFYCLQCGSQAEDIFDTDVGDEDFVDKGVGGGAIYLASHRRQRHNSTINPDTISQSQSQFNASIHSQFWSSLTLEDKEETPSRVKNKSEGVDYNYSSGPFSDSIGPTGPEDFGSIGVLVPSFEDYYNEIRIRYIMGLQLMIEFQCEALVREFKVSPLICGLAGTIWLRFVAATRVFDDGWVDEAINESENQHEGELPNDFKPRTKYSSEPQNMYGRRAVMIWIRSLKRKIPLSCTLAISFLVCHLAREAVLTTDIVKWSLEGKLPYFAAFVEIEKCIGPPSRACPISSSSMFRPLESITAQKMEPLSASIAKSIGLRLPPVNFYAIASRYLQKLSLPSEKILPHACRIYEWSMPPNLWLSASELRLPTRVCVMSILIVAIRILYNINGFGIWEKSLSKNHVSSTSDGTEESDPKYDPGMKQGGEEDSDSPSLKDSKDNESGPRFDDVPYKIPINTLHLQESELEAAELLCKVEALYHGIHENYEYSKDLPTYLQHCKDVVFAGLEPSFENHEEQKLIEELWGFYQNKTDSIAAEEDHDKYSRAEKQKRLRLDEEHSRTFPPREKKFKENERVSDPSDGETRSENHGRSKSSQNDQTLKAETASTLKEESITEMKQDMEENRFYYMPPRKQLKKFGYLHYARKRDEGSLTYAVHADYYILLRACAKVVQIETRYMHFGVLSFEKRLVWTEHRINHCLQLTPPNLSCEFCTNPRNGDASYESLGLSNLNI
ncbi:TATA box-binding protein-associated factor RNA polymerase I subunit B isoform X2 [Humulus lupulus]|uniref:TATA box-binding protein-associated factor RNA polymerase I subunit B isoform X2 n=1 Tax=Humulus lupulus TaxID=3486 RepID=UPI002B410E02|nr:TATA box-binding protein-associated factor RNA polymerase I subunit B isoform X2 [Humulus lupulus]